MTVSSSGTLGLVGQDLWPLTEASACQQLQGLGLGVGNKGYKPYCFCPFREN